MAALLRELSAPPRLAAHLRLVHEVAYELGDWFAEFCPTLAFDREAVLFGAATHDRGKVVHTAELDGPGSAHEPSGREPLLAYGFAPERARFAATHGSWAETGVSVEELLVTTADKVWKGKRVTGLEDLLIGHLVRASEPAPSAGRPTSHSTYRSPGSPKARPRGPPALVPGGRGLDGGAGAVHRPGRSQRGRSAAPGRDRDRRHPLSEPYVSSG